MCNELPDAELAPFSQDTLALLIGAREERKPHERTIKLFQYKVWTLHPGYQGNAQVNSAAFIAGLKLFLANPDEFQGDEILREMQHLRIDDWLMWAPFEQFDSMNKKRVAQSRDVVGVIDFLFRHVIYDRNERTRSLSRALHFEIERRRLPGPDPLVHPRTIVNRLRAFRTNSIFAYLREKQGLDFLPPVSQDGDFAQRLIDDAQDLAYVRSVFGAYTEVRGTLGKRPGHLDFLRENCPTPMLEAHGFTPEEERLIANYNGDDLL